MNGKVSTKGHIQLYTLYLETSKVAQTKIIVYHIKLIEQ